jgi:hypothetical protein
MVVNNEICVIRFIVDISSSQIEQSHASSQVILERSFSSELLLRKLNKFVSEQSFMYSRSIFMPTLIIGKIFRAGEKSISTGPSFIIHLSEFLRKFLIDSLNESMIERTTAFIEHNVDETSPVSPMEENAGNALACSLKKQHSIDEEIVNNAIASQLRKRKSGSIFVNKESKAPDWSAQTAVQVFNYYQMREW